MNKNSDVYTLEELAELLQVTRRSLYNWIKSGKLKAFKAGREWRVTGEAVDEFTAHGTENASQE